MEFSKASLIRLDSYAAPLTRNLQNQYSPGTCSNTSYTDDHKLLIELVTGDDVDEVQKFFTRKKDFGLHVDHNYRVCAIAVAIDHNRADILELLLQNHFKAGGSLFTAVREGSKECVAKLLPYIQPYRDQGPEDITSGLFLSPIMLAIHMKQFDIIEHLVNQGYRVKLPDRETNQANNVSITLNDADDSDDDDDDDENENIKRREDSLMLSSLIRIHYHRALANPLYIAYFYLKNIDTHPMFTIFRLNTILKEQGEVDFEFQMHYKELSKDLERFAVDLLEQCRTVGEIKIMTNVMDELKEMKEKDQLKYIEVKTEGAEELTVMNLAISSGNVELVAHPYSQLRLDEFIYRNVYTMSSCEPSWRQRGLASRMGYVLRHFLFLPLLSLIFVFFPNSHFGRGMTSPLVKFYSHSCSFLMFIALLIVSSFQDSLVNNIATPTIIDWLILVWVVTLIIQEIKEFYFQGFRRYVNQWWNIISCLMLLFFVSSYIIYLIAYGISHSKFATIQIQSLSIEFTPATWYQLILVSNGLFSLGIVLSFVHLSSSFQLNHVFGPMQLSLYKIMIDVAKFLVFFFTLFMAFGFALRRLYSQYISTQRYLTYAIAAGKFNTTQIPDTDHAFANAYNSLYGLFWAVFGMTDVTAFDTNDKNFYITKIFGEVLFGSFLILMVIIAVNMLIAMMSQSYTDIANDAANQWRMSRTRMWMNWVDKGNVIPPPFNIFPSIKIVLNAFAQILAWLKDICCCYSNNREHQLDTTELHKSLELKAAKRREKIRRILQRYLHKCKTDSQPEDSQAVMNIKEMQETMYKEMQGHFNRPVFSPLRRNSLPDITRSPASAEDIQIDVPSQGTLRV